MKLPPVADLRRDLDSACFVVKDKSIILVGICTYINFIRMLLRRLVLLSQIKYIYINRPAQTESGVIVSCVKGVFHVIIIM
jgi:hypothetical protein